MPTEKRQRKRENSRLRAAEVAAARKRAQQRRRLVTIGPAALVVGALLVFLIIQSGGKSKSNVSTATTAPPTSGPSTTTAGAVAPGATLTGPTPCPKPDGSSPRTTKFAQAPPTCITAGKHYTATMTTDAGTITITLDPVKAPVTVNNFVVLARYHYFDGTAFHRVIPDFVDQGGDPTATGTGGPGYQFKDELPAPGDYQAGSLAMANSGPNTNGSQFFIVDSANGAKTLVSAVQGKASYTLFGQVTSGMDVVQKINADGTDAGTPKVLHKIVSVTVAES